MLAERAQRAPRRPQRVPDGRPDRRGHDGVERQRAEHQDHEEDPVPARLQRVQQAGADRPQVDAAVPDVQRREPAQDREEDAEELGVGEPGAGPVAPHAPEREHRVGEREHAHLERLAGGDPGHVQQAEQEELADGRPDAEVRQAVLPVRRPRRGPDPADQRIQRPERVDRVPQRADQAREDGHAGPEVDPGQQHGQVALGLHRAEEAGDDHRQQADQADQAGRPVQPGRAGQPGQHVHLAPRVLQRGGPGAVAGEDRHHDERDPDHGCAGPHEGRERQRQVVPRSEDVQRDAHGDAPLRSRRPPERRRHPPRRHAPGPLHGLLHISHPASHKNNCSQSLNL